MLPYLHIILTLMFAGILYPFLGWNSLVVFLSGFVFDIDHYFYYGLKKGEWSFVKAYFYCIPGSRNYEKHEDVLHISHTWEFWLLIFILGIFLYPIFLFILIGLIFHMILDWLHLTLHEGVRARAWSLIGWLRRN